MRNVYYNETILLPRQKRRKTLFELVEKLRFENNQYFSTGTKRQPKIMFVEILKGSFV